MNTKTQLIIFLLFAVLVNYWQFTYLIFVLFLLLTFLILFKNHHYLRLTYRLKWFYLVMLTIFALNTPGEHIRLPLISALTYEGLLMGFEQVLRIVTMLAILSIILMKNTKKQLISALYFLMMPLSFIGFDAKQFAVRLWLTLHYVETQPLDFKRQSFKTEVEVYLQNLNIENDFETIEILLENQPLTMADFALIFLVAIIFVATIFDWTI
ncbi:MAG: CbiQ family ECF transporter T component [Methylophilaceae bacterium]|nr:CbiQ family ECF transporter T component [Methylophilaceae bacterium]